MENRSTGHGMPSNITASVHAQVHMRASGLTPCTFIAVHMRTHMQLTFSLRPDIKPYMLYAT